MTMYVNNTHTQKKLELACEFRSLVEYKVNLQTATVCFYSSKWKVEKFF